jgi:hypothetical protein
MEGILGTLGLISSGISLASGVGGMMAQMQSNAATNAAIAKAGAYNNAAIQQKADAEAQADEYNATIAVKNSIYAGYERDVALAEIDRTAYRTNGSLIAGYGASGVSSNSGSALDVLADSTASAARDRLNSAFNYDVQIQNYKDQATLDNMAANNARAAAVLGIQANNANTQASILNNNYTSQMNQYKSAGSLATNASNMIPSLTSFAAGAAKLLPLLAL